MEVKPEVQAVAGSPLWQAVFISFAVVFNFVRSRARLATGFDRPARANRRACCGLWGSGFLRQFACPDHAAVFENA